METPALIPRPERTLTYPVIVPSGRDGPVPPECREMIRRGALVSVSTSGGKDSQAMGILLARIVPRDQLVAVHAPLGEVEWPGTVEHIESTIPPGLPLIMAETASGTRRGTESSRAVLLARVFRQAMTILLSCIVPGDRLVAVHAPLGEVEWPGTVGQVGRIEATLPETIKPSVAQPCR